MSTINRRNKMLLNNDDKKQPQLIRPKNIARLIFILCLLNMTSFYCGYCIAYVTALGNKNLTLVYGDIVKVNGVVNGFLIAAVPFGVSIGAFISIFVIPLFARRKLVFILAWLGLIVQGIIQIELLSIFFVCRILQGTITGIFLMLVPIYVRQISPKQINKKGIFGVITNLFLAMGIMGGFLLNTILFSGGLNQILRWRFVISFNFIFVGLIIVSIFFGVIPQSPNSLIQAGRHIKAKIVISIFHRDQFVEQIYNQKVKQIQAGKKPGAALKPRSDSQKKASRIKTFLTFQLPMMQQFTGVNAYISQMGFLTLKFQDQFGLYIPFIMGFVQFATALFSMYYLYRFNRRKMILIGSIGTALCCFALGFLFHFLDRFPHGIWLIVVFIILFMAFNGTFLIPSIPLYLLTVGTKVQLQYSQVTNWFSCGTAVSLFVIINFYFGFSAMFFTFGTLTLFFFICSYIFMIQPKLDLKKLVNDQLKAKQIELQEMQIKT